MLFVSKIISGIPSRRIGNTVFRTSIHKPQSGTEDFLPFCLAFHLFKTDKPFLIFKGVVSLSTVYTECLFEIISLHRVFI